MRLKVGDRFTYYEVTDTKDLGVWEVIRAGEGSATCRKVGLKHTTIVAKHEWVKHPLTGVKYKRLLETPKIIEGDFPETRVVNISVNSMVRIKV